MITAIRRLFFGEGEIAGRLVFEGWNCQFIFEPRDLWIGAFWKTCGHCVDVYICFVPCVPLHISWWYHDPEQ
jgi:hypothetical protein